MNRPKITLKPRTQPTPATNTDRKPWRYTSDQLLHQACEMLRMNRAQLASELNRKLHANQAQLANEQTVTTKHRRPDGTPAHVHTQVWSTSTHLVETTRYGHVRRIQKRPRPAPEVRVITKKPGAAR